VSYDTNGLQDVFLRDDKLRTTLKVDAAAGEYGITVALRAHLTIGSTALANQPINFTLDGNAVGTKNTDATGLASLSYTIPLSLSVGTHTIQATFTPYTTYDASIGTNTLTVSKRKTKLTTTSITGAVGETVTLTGTLRTVTGNLPLPNKTVSFAIDGAPTVTATTNSSGSPASLSRYRPCPPARGR